MSTSIIVGALSKRGANASDVVLRMLRAITNEFPEINKISLNVHNEYIELASAERLAGMSIPPSSVALGSACPLENKKQCMVLGESKCISAAMSGRIFIPPGAPASLIEPFERILGKPSDIRSSAKELIQQIDGQYSLVLRCGDTLLLARDAVGVRPLYLAENDDLVAFSSRVGPLRTLGLSNWRNIAQPTLISKKEVATIRHSIAVAPYKSDEESIVRSLVSLLSGAIKKMAAKKSKTAILFSGGLDSSILAKLSKDLGIDSTLYCAGSSSSRDLTNARKMALALDMPLVETELTDEEIARQLPSVVRIIESSEMIAVSTSLPLYFAVRESKNRGEKLALYGQGADELFGGYERYERTLISSGYRALCDEMLRDLRELANAVPLYGHIGTMESVELFAPFLDASVVEYSTGVSPRLKLFKKGLRVSRKYILEKTASKIGVPPQLLPKQKVAAQFGSGVAGILDRLSRGAGFTKQLARASGFALPVQAYLQEIGYSVGLLSHPKVERD